MSRIGTALNRSILFKDLVVGGAAIVAVALFVRATSFAQEAAPKATAATPTAWLRVGDALNNVGPARNATEYEQYRKTQAARIKSPAVLEAALRAPGIADLPILKEQREPMNWLTDHLTVVMPLESEVLLVKLPDVDKNQGTKLVNAVVDAFLEKVTQSERNSLLQKSDLLQRAIKEKDEEIAAKRAKAENLSKEFTQTGDAGIIRERYASSLKLATNVRERKLDNELETAAAKLRLAAQANGNSPEAAQAKLDLSIAEAKAEILQKNATELRHEMDDCVRELQGAIVGKSMSETIRSEIKGAEARRMELLKDLDETNLTLNQPPRITILERATESK